MTYKHQEFPAWRYSAEGARVFESQAELDAANGEWFDTPDMVGKTEDKPKRGRQGKT